MAGFPIAGAKLDEFKYWAQLIEYLTTAKLDDVEVFESKGINVSINFNSLDASGSTALNTAVEQSNVGMLRYLLDLKQTDPNLQDDRKDTALHTAIRVRAPATILEMILKRPDIDLTLQNAAHNTPLGAAVVQGNEQHVRMLLEEGSDANAQSSESSPILHKAVEAGNMNILRQLLNKKALNVNVDQLPGLAAPLVLACLKESVPMVKELLNSNKIDPNVRDSQNRPILVSAALIGNETILNAFLTHKKTDETALKRFGVVMPSRSAEATHDKPSNLLLPVRRPRRASNEAVMPIMQDFSDYPWSDKGRHAWYKASETFPGKWGMSLGGGSYGSVTRYQCEGDGLILAVKIMRQQADAEYSSRKEKAILERIKDPHAVQLVGTYLHDRANGKPERGLMLYPAAQSNLDTYLSSATGFSYTRYCQLSLWLGCIAKAVEYLHASGIKHKDLKLQNILVDGNGVYLADFGLSRKFVEGDSQSDGPIKTTKRYCAPEAVDKNKSRGRSADIYSLACCYVAMVTVMVGRTSSALARKIGDNAFHEVQDETFEWLDGIAADAMNGPHLQGPHFKNSPGVRDGFLQAINTIRQMMDADPGSRPVAASLYPAFLVASPWICPTCHPKGSRYGKPLIKYIRPQD